MSSDRSIGGRIARTIMPSVVRRRFAYKLGVLLFVVVVVLALVGGVGYVRANNSVEDNADQQMESVASIQSDGTGDWIQEMKRQTSALATDDALKANDSEAVEGQLISRSNNMPQSVREVHVIDREQGTLVASHSKGSSGKTLDEIDEPWANASQYRDISDSVYQVDMSEPSYEAVDGRAVYFSTPVMGDEDRVVVLVGGIKEQVLGLHQPFDEQQTTIVSADDASVIAGAEDAPLPAEVRNGEAQPGIESVETLESDSHVHAVTSIVGTDWLLVTTVPKSVAFQTANIVGQSMLGVVGVGLIALFGITIVIGRQTSGPLTRLRDKARTMEQGQLDVDLETSRIDEIGQLYDGFGSMRDALRDQIREAETARETAETAKQEAQRTNEQLERKADEYSRVMRECARGDLTQRMDPDTDNDAMESIAREFNEMIGAIEETTAHVKQFAGEVAAASEEVTASSEEVRNASEQVTESVQRISDGAERQHEHVQEATSELNTLSSTTEEIASSSDAVADIAERTATAGDRGREAANQAAEEMTVVADDTDDVVEQFERLEREIEQIDELTEFIDEIAEQTNMLALNANIEASRTHSDGGDGFGAVAKEVKQLSQETREATDEIEQQLASLQSAADDAATVVGRTSEQVTRSVDTVEEAVEALAEIATYAERTNEGIQEISTATDDQAVAVSETASMVDDVAMISEQTSQETESVAASAEEQTSALTQVSHNASRLAEQAGQLSNTLDRFDTAVDAEPDGVVADELQNIDADIGTDTGIETNTAVDDEATDDREDSADNVFEYVSDDETDETAADAGADRDGQSNPAPDE
ncbi:methyl-accepting chemotaxis protein [Haloterrigena salifodinae]|uniref:methyl-accepting chemotaxis protein n=1 Tax=Haloterrigena salifodinae TaxID=2675099 RepID=UPI0020139794|nr:methyl-accepting chemotaxis protein [Haloterrigena salifodinae]